MDCFQKQGMGEGEAGRGVGGHILCGSGRGCRPQKSTRWSGRVLKAMPVELR